jgi:small subunit ribosomal protein S3Ae
MATQKGIDKWKAKKWFSVRAPKAFNDALVGEMPANDEKAAVGRNVIVSLDTLTHNSSHSYTNVMLKVTEVKGDSAQTKLAKMELVPSYIRSFVRRYRSVSSAVIPVTTKDGVAAVVKLIVITRARSNHTKIIGLRKEMVVFTLNFFKETEMDAAIGAILEGKFQAELGSKLNHITDLNKVEVRKLEIS